MHSTSKREDLATGGSAAWDKTETGDGNMSAEKREKFDGYAEKYDEWFVKNANLFESELRLFKKALGDVSGKRLLSVGGGSGLCESCIDAPGVDGRGPSADMAAIAERRGVKVVHCGTIEDFAVPADTYDIIYFNGSSSYMEDLAHVYGKCLAALKEGGKLVLLDVPKESAFGFMYLLGKSLGTYEHEFLAGTMPALPYPLALAASGIWHTTEGKIGILKKLGVVRFEFWQTLVKNPMYTNEAPEEVREGYKSGGYVAIVAEKPAGRRGEG